MTQHRLASPWSLGPRRRRSLVGGIAIAVSLLLVGCGDTDDTDGSGGTGTPADVAAAEAAIAAYVEQPTAFPIDTPLATTPTGKRVAFMDCGSAICGVLAALSEPAAAALGIEFTAIKTGLTADSVSAAFDTVVEADYDGVFVPAIQPALWERELGELEDAGIPVVTAGQVGVDRSRVDATQVSDAMIERTAKLAAAYVVTEQGDDAHVVVYVTPENGFNPVLNDYFSDELEALCPRCSVRSTNVPAAALGAQAPTIVSDDLQANPDTTAAVFLQSEATGGLPQALEVAGISDDLLTLAVFPDPGTLQLIQSGQIDVGLAFDVPVVAWTEIDSLARLMTGEPVSPGAAEDAPPQMFVTKDLLTGDVTRGWVAYPDFMDRFKALWSQAS